MLSSLTTYGEVYQGDADLSLSLAMNNSARRGPWLPEEDQALLQLVRTQGANNWVRISQQIQHRSPKQCRERYHQNLKPSLKHDPISAQEGEVIERLVQEMGKRWAEIARRLGNRSDNAVKNWWNGSVNRRKRNPAHTTTGFKQVGSRLQPVPFTLTQSRTYLRPSMPPAALDPPTPLSHQGQVEIAQSFASNAVQTPSPMHPYNPPRSSYDTSIVNTGYSVPGSIMDTPNSRPGLSKVATSASRPEFPPLRSSSLYLSKIEGSFPSFERPPISPALSENSRPHAPSLISDNQSMYSISPRTVTTPNPGILAPTETPRSLWPETQLAAYQGSQQTSYKPPSLSNPTTKYNMNLPLDSTFYRESIALSGDRCKDTRMNVSALLQ